MKRIVFMGVWFVLFHASLSEADCGCFAAVPADDSTHVFAEQRAKRDSIDGVYIPVDLKDCFVRLDTLLSAEDRELIRNLENREETIILHHGLGMWLRNNWGLWNGSRLQKYFTDRGIRHPDDMSGLILGYYYDWLNGNHKGWEAWMNDKADISGD